jgi:hypothetical protein|tara:strand:+ start:136 stop:588 length:453 start_codon:yes stop_codon:yes gene_type:complete
MAFSGNYMCTSFKKELLYGAHDFDASSGDTFKIALYTSSATMTAATTAYATTNEISGTGYTAGGEALTPVDPTSSGTTALTDFTDETWGSATITARGALIYNSTPNTTSISLTNPAVLVLDFGSDKAVTSGNFTVVFPTADSSTAIIRIA